MATEKIAVTIERELLEKLEQARRSTHESRSAFVARALRELLAVQARNEHVRRYVAAHRQTPETPADAEAADRLALEALATLAWEDE